MPPTQVETLERLERFLDEQTRQEARRKSDHESYSKGLAHVLKEIQSMKAIVRGEIEEVRQEMNQEIKGVRARVDLLEGGKSLSRSLSLRAPGLRTVPPPVAFDPDRTSPGGAYKVPEHIWQEMQSRQNGQDERMTEQEALLEQAHRQLEEQTRALQRLREERDGEERTRLMAEHEARGAAKKVAELELAEEKVKRGRAYWLPFLVFGFTLLVASVGALVWLMGHSVTVVERKSPPPAPSLSP